jgi:iduronate 2-sulfatase
MPSRLVRPALSLFICFCSVAFGQSNGETKPNFLVLFIDDLRPMSAEYGESQMHTPNLDKISKEGIRFDQAYSQVPTCGASRASFFTSLYPTVARFPDFKTWVRDDAPQQITLPQQFKEAGYTTISNGKVFHHQADKQNASWSEPAYRAPRHYRDVHNRETKEFMEKTEIYEKIGPKSNWPKKPPMIEIVNDDPMETIDGMVTQKTLNDLERLAKTGKPFFLVSGLHKPHMPFFVPKHAWEHYPYESIETAPYRELPQPRPAGIKLIHEQHAYVPMDENFEKEIPYNSEKYHQLMRRGYYASVTHSDDLVGRVLDRVEQLGLSESTYIVILGDHGFLLGENNQWAKNVLLPEALRTALWIKGPGLASNGSAKTFVELVDVYPTLLELAGIDYDLGSLNGRSFTKVLKNPAASHRSAAYSRFRKGDAVTTADFYYVLWQADDAESALLIDLKIDPQKTTNLSGQPEYHQVERKLRAKVLSRIYEASSAY